MIGRLTGRVLEKAPDRLLLEVGGVGYDVAISLTTFGRLTESEGVLTLHTHLIVREDAHQLYGFSAPDERALFRSLIGVNGVGPRLALAILSGPDADAFAAAVLEKNVQALTGLPGVGKKTAERLIVEMQDRVAAAAAAPAEDAARSHIAADAEAALVGLGYRPREVARAMASVSAPAEDLETLIRQALKALMQG